MKAVINDNNLLYVQDDTPNAEQRYREAFPKDTGIVRVVAP